MNAESHQEQSFPLVSVVVTSYNQKNTISQTLDSILNQRCNFHFEVIIGDDSSTDGTQVNCREYQKTNPDKVRCIYNDVNQGVAYNWVNTISQAKGKYIAACASDDYWHNRDKLQLQVDYMESHPECGLLYTDYNIMNTEENKLIANYLTLSKTKCIVGADLTREIFQGKVPISVVTVCFKKELFDQYIPVAIFKNHFKIEDWPTWLILSKYCQIEYLPISTATYRKGHESLSNPAQYERIKRRLDADKFMYKYLCEMFPDDVDYKENDFIVYENNILLSLALKKNDFQSAKSFAMALKDHGFNKLRVKLSLHWFTFKLFVILKKIRKLSFKN